MNLKRIKELREVLEAENISYGELHEIECTAQAAGVVTPEKLESGMLAGDMLDELEVLARSNKKSGRKTFKQLCRLDTHKDLIDQAHNWCCEGWGLPDDIKHFPTPEQLAAALLMEASDQDGYVKRGDSHPDYPKQLRGVAMDILRSCHENLDEATEQGKQTAER